MRPLYALGLSVFLLGCPAMSQSPPARAQEAALEMNLNARFGRMELAAESVAPEAKEQFFHKRKGWGGKVRVADYEMTGLKMVGKKEEDAEVFMRVAWYRIDEGDLRVTTVRQKWHSFKGSWKLVGEERLDGDAGLLGEYVAPPKTTQPTLGSKQAQFPTIHIGNGPAEAPPPKTHDATPDATP